MSKIDCEVIKDLLPLYADDSCSEGTKKLVEEHISDCEDCFEHLKRMQAPIDENKIKEITAKKAFKRVKKRWIASILLVVFLIPIVYLTVNQVSGSGVSFTAIKTMFLAQGLIDDIKSLNADGVSARLEEQRRRLYEDTLTNPDYWNTIIAESNFVGSDNNDGELKIGLEKYLAITVDNIRYFAIEADAEIQGFYEEYQEDNDANSFWFKVLNSGKALIPEKALNEIKNSDKYVIDEEKLNKLIKIVYQDNIYYVKNTIGAKEEDYISNSVPTMFKLCDIVPDSVRKFYTDELGEMKNTYEDSYANMQQQYKEMGIDKFLETSRNSVSERYDKMKEKGISIKSIDFANVTNGVVTYTVTFAREDKEIATIQLIVSFKDGYLSAYEGYNKRQLLNLSDLDVTVIGGPITWDNEITMSAKK